MKSYILPILLCLSLPLSAQTIPLDSFYVPGATWTEAVNIRTSSSSHSGSWGAEGKELKIERDEVISGKNYHVISKRDLGGYRYSYDYSGTSFGINPPSSTYSEFGRIRVEDDRVYFTQDWTFASFSSQFVPGVEYLLYDFNLNVGSAVPDPIYTASSPAILVESIDTIEVSPGIYSVVYHDSLRSDHFWIRGIGNSREFFSGFMRIALPTGPTSGYSGSLSICYSNPALGISYNFPFSTPELEGNLQRDCFNLGKLAVSEPKVADGDLSIYPNPTSDGYFSVWGIRPDLVKQVVISDVTGKTISSLLHPFGAAKTQMRIPHEPGIYIVSIEFEDGNIVTRRVNKLQSGF